MHDINLIAKDPAKYKYYLKIRNEKEEIIDNLLNINRERKELISKINDLRSAKNNISRLIGHRKYSTEQEKEKLINESLKIDQELQALEPVLNELENNLKHLLMIIPNVVDEDVPIGKDSSDNVIVYQEGEIIEKEILPHWEIGEKLNIIDFERGVKLSGSRFYILKGYLAKLQRALINFFLDFHTTYHNYKEVYLPFVVKKYCLEGAGQLPKFEDNLYHDWEDDIWLVPTAEVPLTICIETKYFL